ncbi:MAG: zinc-binding dehydrogenase, partial [Desulfobacterales bacterium]
CDLVFDFTGKTETLDMAMKCAKNLGQVVIVGYQYGENFIYPTQQLISREITITGCRASTFANQGETLKLVEQGIVTPVIDRIFALQEANGVLQELKQKGFVGRAVLKP